jgi:chlorite dismutase
MARPTIQKPDLREHGAPREGQPQATDRRLFMQFQAFGNCDDPAPLVQSLKHAGVEAVVYEDVADPRGIGVLTLAEDPGAFLGRQRTILRDAILTGMVQKHEYTMLGRTYALGYEPDLDDTLFGRPRRTAMNPAWPWAVWYPLRRKGDFVSLPAEEQRAVLMEHGVLGRAFGEADYAHDIRLACQGLDRNDNDFVVGLVGRELYPLSAIVQRMRMTRQTSQFLAQLGPFFVGRAVWQSASP